MSVIHISENAYPELIEYLREKGHEVRLVKTDERVGEGVGNHADLRVCVIGKKAIFADISGLEPKYPENAAFCAAALDRYLIHRLDITAPEILEAAKKAGKTLINVRQGYTRCSCAVIDGNSLITADAGIAKALKKHPDIDVLKVGEGHVLLPGFDCGFIGGAMGRVGDEILFNGDITKHPDYDKIREFIENRGLKLRAFGGNLRDIGSIIEERTEKMRRFNVFYKMAPGTRDAFLKDLMDNKISECALAIDGCRQYQYMVPVDDPDLLVLMEKRETEDARQKHIAAPHFAKIQELKGTRVIGWESEEY